MGAVILAGAQRFEPTIGAALAALGIDGTVAIVTAGWQERESEDEELAAHLDGRTVNLRLHHRADLVFAADAEFRAAHHERQRLLRFKQDFYRIRLEHELEANHVIRQRTAPDDILAEEERASLNAIRILDDYHLAQCARIHREFEEAHAPLENPYVAAQRVQIAEVLAGAQALAIAGGHVASLLNRMRLFGVAELLTGQTVVAWSAGAMAIGTRVVLFHDEPPQGAGASEILDAGLGLVDGVVPFPQPETRLRLDDPERVGVLAGRFAPALCLALPARSTVLLEDGQVTQCDGALRLSPDGSVAPLVADTPTREAGR
ncbi:MAG: hypothetical protein H6719_25330 [Sandaracinaceae bacterium]|nr:hypothetical protein [Sandaracinaceae bacterium]